VAGGPPRRGGVLHREERAGHRMDTAGTRRDGGRPRSKRGARRLGRRADGRPPARAHVQRSRASSVAVPAGPAPCPPARSAPSTPGRRWRAGGSFPRSASVGAADPGARVAAGRGVPVRRGTRGRRPVAHAVCASREGPRAASVRSRRGARREPVVRTAGPAQVLRRRGRPGGARSARSTEDGCRGDGVRFPARDGNRQPAAGRRCGGRRPRRGRGRAGISRVAVPGPVGAAGRRAPGPGRRPVRSRGGARPARFPGRGWAAVPAPAGRAGGPPGRGAGRPAGESGPERAPRRGKAPRAGSWACWAAR
jgi:translation initiation factor IF-2